MCIRDRCSFACGIAVTIAVSQINTHKSALASDEKNARADAASKEDPMLYELRTYYTPEGKLDALNARFRNHTLTLFEKHGMKTIMSVSYTHLRAHETVLELVCRLLLDQKNME